MLQGILISPSNNRHTQYFFIQKVGHKEKFVLKTKEIRLLRYFSVKERKHFLKNWNFCQNIKNESISRTIRTAHKK
jgi:hypothetical protein